MKIHITGVYSSLLSPIPLTLAHLTQISLIGFSQITGILSRSDPGPLLSEISGTSFYAKNVKSAAATGIVVMFDDHTFSVSGG
jgi:hypothetical protein